MTLHTIARHAVLGSLLLTTTAIAQVAEPLTPVVEPLTPAAEPPPPCYFRDRPCSFPHLTLGFEGGVGAFEEGSPFGFGKGTGSGVSPGPSWGFRIGWEFTRWLAVDAHYMGTINLIGKDYSPAGPARLVTNADAEVRLTLPLSYVQPYLFVGAGIYGTSISGATAEARLGTAFNGSTEPGVPMGVGVGIPITEQFSIGAEATYHFFIGEKFSADEDIAGGDVTTFNAVLRVRI